MVTNGEHFYVESSTLISLVFFFSPSIQYYTKAMSSPFAPVEYLLVSFWLECLKIDKAHVIWTREHCVIAVEHWTPERSSEEKQEFQPVYDEKEVLARA